MNDEEKALGRHAAIVAVQFLNAAIIIASPMVSVKLEPASLREHAIEQTRAVLEAVNHMRPSRGNAQQDDMLIKMEPEVRRMQELLDGWAPDHEMPRGLMDAARACLRAYGAPEPAEGWDHFEG